MNRTTNYKLCQWEAEDKVRRTDFNEDNAKIDRALGALRDGKADVSEIPRLDAAVAAKAAIVTGFYVGDSGTDRFISLGATPKAVFLVESRGYLYYSGSVFGGLFMSDLPLRNTDKSVAAKIVENGFIVTYEYRSGCLTNEKELTYCYLALM